MSDNAIDYAVLLYTEAIQEVYDESVPHSLNFRNVFLPFPMIFCKTFAIRTPYGWNYLDILKNRIHDSDTTIPSEVNSNK